MDVDVSNNCTFIVAILSLYFTYKIPERLQTWSSLNALHLASPPTPLESHFFCLPFFFFWFFDRDELFWFPGFPSRNTFLASRASLVTQERPRRLMRAESECRTAGFLRRGGGGGGSSREARLHRRHLPPVCRPGHVTWGDVFPFYFRVPVPFDDRTPCM